MNLPASIALGGNCHAGWQVRTSWQTAQRNVQISVQDGRHLPTYLGTYLPRQILSYLGTQPNLPTGLGATYLLHTYLIALLAAV